MPYPIRLKLEFLIEDSSDTSPVTDAELQAWLERHPDQYRIEPQVAFRQVYVSPDRRGAATERDAKILLATLSAAGRDVPTSIGDSLMLPRDVDLSTRSSIAQQFGASKSAQGMSTADFYKPEREAQVLRKALERNKGPLRNEEIARLFREIMSACLAQQEPLKVAFLGPEGTFSQQAVLKHFGHSVRALPLTAISEVFEEVQSGHADFGVVPSLRARPLRLRSSSRSASTAKPITTISTTVAATTATGTQER